MDSFVPERTAIYVSQLDHHFGGCSQREDAGACAG